MADRNNECEDGLGKSLLRITVLHHEVCRGTYFSNPSSNISFPPGSSLNSAFYLDYVTSLDITS